MPYVDALIAFQLKTKAAPVTTVSPAPITTTAASTAQVVINVTSPPSGSGGPAPVASVVNPTALSFTQRAPPPGIPSYRVNDNSRVEVTLSSHEFETSMARNDFSSESTEASVSGGFAGFSASVSAGYSKSDSTTSKDTTNTYMKTMIASYLFPRTDIVLHPEDLEPTPELQGALDTIAKLKNIKDLRQLYQDFGQVFCQHVTVGGRLQSTRIMKSSTVTSEYEQKQQFKVSVGVQVSTPIGVGAGVKHDNEKGTSTSTSTGTEDQAETNVFEAAGGDTILASNPLAWIPTVAKFWNWRVISRDALKPLVDTISGIDGYADVKSHFVQAVPTLSTYIELSNGHEVKSRLRLVSDQKNLSKSYLDKTQGVERFDDPAYYLGHIPDPATRPQYYGLKDPMKDPFGPMLEYPGLQNTMFTPAEYDSFFRHKKARQDTDSRTNSYRAPSILGYDSEQARTLSMTYDQGFLNTVWTITAPFTDSLQHGCRISLTTNVITKDINAPDPTAPPGAPPKAQTIVNQPPASLAVFRNQQGVFLPAMTTSDGVHYWRILKVNGTTPGENICEGDTVRLCWAFADQDTGFRDFTADIYGRRRTRCPADLDEGVLYLKLPWPRFEMLGTAEGVNAGGGAADGVGRNTLLMGTQPGVEDEWADVVSLPMLGRNATGSSAYMMQDVQFRIDLVGNDGKGDTGDYLLGKDDLTGFQKSAEDVRREAEEKYLNLLEKALFFSSPLQGGKVMFKSESRICILVFSHLHFTLQISH
ncbi:uncharacterized protein KY384_004655 [Bacidia gigantensis]|uniref:uncharacterized protein n=1 Tax=Bacidia gigantensis TaxID=2732470 RepID=UPI001D0474C8|nr:uncharacterized protein KY384_004655 [Bacidia gigantensis]KAG8530617.1 hypothetical protein KY384_004655 [Bacidia gigantensis]